jgi:hypothetical protein
MAVTQGSIPFDGMVAEMVHPEEADNRFFTGPGWRAFISAADFPIEHLLPANIRAIFSGVGEVMDIDPASLDHDYSSLWFIVNLTDPSHIHRELHIFGPGAMGPSPV